MDSSLTARLVDSVVSGYRTQVMEDHAAAALFDFATCVAAGHEFVVDWFDAPAGRATVWGSNSGVASEQAAALNAAAARQLDRDDLHWPSLTHASSLIWPVALSLGEECDVSFAVAARAATVGYEVTARLATALGPSLRSHWHPTTTAGTIGAAVTAALVLAPDDTKVAASAAGHATSVCAGMIQVVMEHSPSSVFNSAHAARTAVVAARAANGGMQGIRRGLEGARGLFAAVAPEANAFETMDSSQAWALTALALRPYATTGYAQTAVEAALRLRGVEPASIERIEIVAPRGAATIAGSVAPVSTVERWWSIPYAVGVCLVGGEATALEDLSWAENEQLARLLPISSVSHRSDAPPDDLTTTITLVSGGRTVSESAAVHLGHPTMPFDDVDRLAKWTAMVPGTASNRAATVLALCRDATAHSTVGVVGEINRVLVDNSD